jgi:hypothetical protein
MDEDDDVTQDLHAFSLTDSARVRAPGR